MIGERSEVEGVDLAFERPDGHHPPARATGCRSRTAIRGRQQPSLADRAGVALASRRRAPARTCCAGRSARCVRWGTELGRRFRDRFRSPYARGCRINPRRAHSVRSKTESASNGAPPLRPPAPRRPSTSTASRRHHGNGTPSCGARASRSPCRASRTQTSRTSSPTRWRAMPTFWSASRMSWDSSGSRWVVHDWGAVGLMLRRKNGFVARRPEELAEQGRAPDAREPVR
jgi:hypothetical protein